MSLKRLLMMIGVAALLSLGAAACGDDDNGDTEGVTAPAEGSQKSNPSGKTVSIVASVPPTDHGWLGAISKDAQAQADQYDDVDFKLLEAADSDSQAQQIEQVIAEKPDVLVVLPQDGEALTPVAQKAENAGIPVVNIDRLFTQPTRRRRRSSRGPDRCRLHPRRRHGPGRGPGDPQRRSRRRNVPHRRRRLAGGPGARSAACKCSLDSLSEPWNGQLERFVRPMADG